MALSTSGQRWAYIADWLDPNSGVRWTYQLFAYILPNAPVEIEMFDIKNRRHFLKRVKCDSVESSQLYVGSTVTVFARQLHLIAYGDEATKKAVEARSQRTLALILPHAIQHAGRIINTIYGSGFNIINLRMCQMTPEEASIFVALQQSCPAPDATVAMLASGPAVAVELMAASGIRKWLDLLGPCDPAAAKQQAPDSIRAMFATDAIHAAAHGSNSPDQAAEELAFFFGNSSSSGSGSTASTSSCSTMMGCRSLTSSSSTGRAGPVTCQADSTCRQPAALAHTCCRCCGTTLGIILPHAVKDGVAGLILEDVQAAFQVTGLQLFKLHKQAAAEFLEVYKGVVPPGEFSSMMDELISGPCIAVEVASRDGSEAVEAFRRLVGPRDPELARMLRPNTLRARFGVSCVRNAVHCTDLVEDGPLEATYFFSVLQQPTALAH